jgi:gamma-glutamyltranspeptidase/glutathione hydrolase
MRPAVTGRTHVISTGHYLATMAGLKILEAGGNAVDAGVAAGLALGVVQSDLVNIAGVAPIMIRPARAGRIVTIDGLGSWPRATDLDYFVDACEGKIPAGVRRTVVPAAPAAWIAALRRWGTLSFGEVAASAIQLARGGFAMHPLMAENLASFAEGYKRWPYNAAIYLPKGRPPRAGELFVQRDLAKSLQYMVDEERRARRKGRAAGLKAARDAFYVGDIARAIVKHQRANDGWLDAADLADYEVEIGSPQRLRFRGTDVYTCGPWCQGPVLLQALAILDGYDLAALGHNSVDYVHVLSEALKLAFADREHHYADPRFTRVPMARLLSKDYAASRRALVRMGEAWREMPPAGDARGHRTKTKADPGDPMPALDTSYVAVIDRWGNAFSATPSDTSYNSPLVPGTGLCPSSRGSQSWAVRGHPAAALPGRRPRLTPNPVMAVRAGTFVMPFGTPGGDVQSQAMLQAFLNVVVFGMDPQQAVEAPRFATFSFPNSFEPHQYFPGRLNMERRFGEETGAELARRGHAVEWWPDGTWRAGGVCMVAKDLTTGMIAGGADPRRPSYAAGW